MMNNNVLNIFKKLSFIIITLCLLSLLNYIINPYWTFNHNIFNLKQLPINLYQQKTNYLSNQKKYYFKQLILGSSRSCYINQHQFSIPTFNFSLFGISPNIYPKLINNFIKFNKIPPQKLFVELNFSMANKKLRTKNLSLNSKPHTSIVEDIKELISLTTSIHSVDILIKANLLSPEKYIINHSIFTINHKLILKNYISTTKTHLNHITSKPLHSLSEYQSPIATLKLLKNKTASKKYLVYIPPISAQYFKMQTICNKNTTIYRRWIKDILKEVNKIFFFSGINNITKNQHNFIDGEHFTPQIGTLLIKSLTDKQYILKNNFATVITTKNVDKFLTRQFELAQEYKYKCP